MAARRAPDEELAGPAAAPTEGWTTVGPSGRARGPAPPPPTPGQLAARRLRPPRSAAVVITLQPAAAERGVTYAAVISEARSKINLASLEINQLRFKRAVTGARVLEVAGASAASGDKADALAKKLKEVIGSEVATVSRPVKAVEIRVSGLDDSVTSGEVTAAVALSGACGVEAVTCGEVRPGASGACAAWVRCPVAAAKRILAAGRLPVGWGSARVELLDARPLRCFRCLEPGHVRALCASEVDRSDQCYRCGEPGHKAGACHAKPRCTLCAAAGRPTEHACGSRICPAPAKRSAPAAGGGLRAPPQPARLPPPGAGAGNESAAMDTI